MGKVLATIIGSLSVNEQLELLESLLTFFVNQGILDAAVLENCSVEKFISQI